MSSANGTSLRRLTAAGEDRSCSLVAAKGTVSPVSMPPGGKEHKVLEGLLNPALGSSLLFAV